MAKELILDKTKLDYIREADARVQSYNIEMTELVGGTFWAPYTPEQISGAEEFPSFENEKDSMAALQSMFVLQPAINLKDSRLRALASAFGPSIVRFSGSWATGMYYDFDDHTGGVVPEGFSNILTLEQWQGALDFAKQTGTQILVSVANCSGVHENGNGVWTPNQAELLWSAATERGVKIDYAEFMNEPNIVTNQGLPPNYSAADFSRDHELFARWLAENHPETVLVGPCAADGPMTNEISGDMLQVLHTEDLMNGMITMPRYFSYHSYTGTSERGRMFGTHFPFSDVLTDSYLSATMDDLKYFSNIRDKYVPGADLWVTESADAGCGGDTWAPTYAECFRYLAELGQFNRNARGIIFHNTLASSAYGFLEAGTFTPRPQYWAALLFKRLMGNRIYDCRKLLEEQPQLTQLYAQSCADSRDGICWMLLNTSKTECVEVSIPECTLYVLDSDALRSTDLRLNGQVLQMEGEALLPELAGQKVPAGTVTVQPLSIAFFVTE